nr:MAG TPA_asm: hypothetical protein [Caudoviricetes sp.]
MKDGLSHSPSMILLSSSMNPSNIIFVIYGFLSAHALSHSKISLNKGKTIIC